MKHEYIISYQVVTPDSINSSKIKITDAKNEKEAIKKVKRLLKKQHSPNQVFIWNVVVIEINEEQEKLNAIALQLNSPYADIAYRMLSEGDNFPSHLYHNVELDEAMKILNKYKEQNK